MIAALKQAIAIYADDPEWARVRPPLVEPHDRAGEIARRAIKSGGLRDERNQERLIRNQ